jgi:hypothetical protein
VSRFRHKKYNEAYNPLQSLDPDDSENEDDAYNENKLSASMKRALFKRSAFSQTKSGSKIMSQRSNERLNLDENYSSSLIKQSVKTKP